MPAAITQGADHPVQRWAFTTSTKQRPDLLSTSASHEHRSCLQSVPPAGALWWTELARHLTNIIHWFRESVDPVLTLSASRLIWCISSPANDFLLSLHIGSELVCPGFPAPSRFSHVPHFQRVCSLCRPQVQSKLISAITWEKECYYKSTSIIMLKI